MISRSMAVLVWFLAILVYGRFGPTPPQKSSYIMAVLRRAQQSQIISIWYKLGHDVKTYDVTVYEIR